MSTPNDPQNPPAPNPEPITTPPVESPELLAARQEAAALRATLAASQKEANELKKAGLKSTEDWKGLSEIEKTRADNAEAESTRLKKALVDDKKYGELKAEAVRQGINPVSLSDLDLLDFNGVVAENINGRVQVSGVAAAITKLKADRPNWFQGAPPNINPFTPGGGDLPPGGTVTQEQLLAAQKKWSTSKSDSDLKAYEALIYQHKKNNGT